MFMSCRFPLQPRHVDGVLYVDFYGISTVNNHKQDQMSQLARERETLQERLVQITRERDTALRVSENRRRAWEMHRVQSLERANYLPDQIEAGLVEIHRLNNLLHPIPRPIPVYPEVGPQVIVADDDF